jgi:antirestriction protein ArdC
VFNVAQVDGLPEEWTTLANLNKDAKPAEALEAIVTATKAQIENHGDRACYLPSEDRIVLPNLDRFAKVGATAFHELSHWTGKRLDRDLSGRFGDASYAFEELVAELGAAFCCARCGVEGTALQNNAAYLGHWLRILRQDKHAIFTAAKLAREAAAYILFQSAPVETGEEVD